MKTRRTLRAVAIGWLVTGACASVVDAQEANFSYGHIFVRVAEVEACNEGFAEVILEVDPSTGQWSVFADSDDGLCGANGLRFDPGGQRLLVLNSAFFIGGPGWVQAFRADGTGEVILDGTDGLVRPFGANGLAFDGDGNLYVADAANLRIIRFPGGAGPGEVFADADDGITGRGGLDFAPDGDLFYTAMDAGAVIRITPDGVATVFDVLPVPSSLVFDRLGNLFVAAGQAGVGATIYRYDNADASTRRVLAVGFMGASGSPLPITISADNRHIYLSDSIPMLYAVDAVDGTTSVITDLSQLPFLSAVGTSGIAVFAPASIPTVSMWGALSMSILLIVAGTLVIGRGRLKFAARVCSPVSGER